VDDPALEYGIFSIRGIRREGAMPEAQNCRQYFVTGIRRQIAKM
jgi:hypothetical protein